MEFLGHLLLGLLILANVHAIRGHGWDDSQTEPSSYTNYHIDKLNRSSFANYHIDKLNRSSFPKGFMFGTASSAYQVEGAWNIDGRGPSIWDHFTHKYPEKIKGRANADVSAGFYHRYKEDIQFMKDLNMDSFRFSVSWSRILPNGKLSGGVNEKGIKFYNDVIDYLVAKGLKPIVTLSHWDPPQALEDEYGCFLSPKVVKDFQDYADLCFKTFGNRVKHWITFNEPWSFSRSAYDLGEHAPGRCSAWMNKNCTGGDSGREPYIVSHHQLLSHASAVKLYKTKYKDHQKGKVGITLIALWPVPYSNSSVDRRAAVRALDFNVGCYMNPLVYGDYPSSMRTLLGSRLPDFTAEESKLIKGSYDFIGINYYTAFYVIDATGTCDGLNVSFTTDSKTTLAVARNGVPIGVQAASNWLHIYPKGMFKVLKYIKKKYQNPIIYITENGIDEVNNDILPLERQLKDDFRIKYYYLHLLNVLKAIQDGVRVKAFYSWAITDNFEWADGYTVRFGISYVDFKNGLKRYPKLSAKWFKRFLQK